MYCKQALVCGVEPTVARIVGDSHGSDSSKFGQKGRWEIIFIIRIVRMTVCAPDVYDGHRSDSFKFDDHHF